MYVGLGFNGVVIAARFTATFQDLLCFPIYYFSASPISVANRRNRWDMWELLKLKVKELIVLCYKVFQQLNDIGGVVQLGCSVILVTATCSATGQFLLSIPEIGFLWHFVCFFSRMRRQLKWQYYNIRGRGGNPTSCPTTTWLRALQLEICPEALSQVNLITTRVNGQRNELNYTKVVTTGVGTYFFLLPSK